MKKKLNIDFAVYYGALQATWEKQKIKMNLCEISRMFQTHPSEATSLKPTRHAVPGVRCSPQL